MNKLASFFLAFLVTIFCMEKLQAAEPWISYEAKSSVFRANFPKTPESKSSSLMIDDNSVVNSEEAQILIDQRPLKNAIKSYVIKFDQTIGPPLKEDEASELVAREFANYESFYKNRNGVIRQKSDAGLKGFWGGEIMITYDDPTFGSQTVKAHILFNETTRLQQIVVGPEEIMNTYQTRDYFDSLQFNGGISSSDKSLLESWRLQESPTGMFSVLYPGEKAPPYFTEDPVLKSDNKSETVSLFITDPVRNQKLLMNVYGYQFNTDLSFDSAKEVLIKKIISRHRNSMVDLTFSKGIAQNPDDMNKFPFTKTSYMIKPPPGFPYLEKVELTSFFTGKNMIVIEMMGSENLLSAPLADNLANHVVFHPEKMAKKAKITTVPPSAPATP